MKTTSKNNLTIERVWPEVNARVNYPIKRVLVELEEKGILDMSNEHIQFCVSWFTCEVSKVGMKRFVEAWNLHRIKGTTNMLGMNVLYRCPAFLITNKTC